MKLKKILWSLTTSQFYQTTSYVFIDGRANRGTKKVATNCEFQQRTQLPKQIAVIILHYDTGIGYYELVWQWQNTTYI